MANPNQFQGQGKRSKIDIILDILRVIREKNNKIKPTHLMYKSNLSHIQMKNYLNEMIKKGLINEIFEKNKKQIIITKKGKAFLSQLLQMKEFQKTFGL
jgi:predicted transcriptional regulator